MRFFMSIDVLVSYWPKKKIISLSLFFCFMVMDPFMSLCVLLYACVFRCCMFLCIYLHICLYILLSRIYYLFVQYTRHLVYVCCLRINTHLFCRHVLLGNRACISWVCICIFCSCMFCWYILHMHIFCLYIWLV